MMRPSVAFAFAALVATGGVAYAAEGKVPPPQCEDFAKLKAEFAKDAELKGTKFTPMTARQYVFLEGVFAGSPITPPGMPPGDGAQLMQLKDKNSILWTRGKQVCMTVIATGEQDSDGHPQLAYMPMPISPNLLKALEAVKTGASVAVSNGDDGEELHL